MTKNEILKNYNLNLNDADEKNFDGLYSILLEFDLFTPSELELVTSLNGSRVEVLLNALYCRAGLRSIEQLINEMAE